MRTLSTKAQLLILHSGLPVQYWSLACNAAAYIQNRVFNRSRNGHVVHRIINTHNVTFNKAIFPKKVSTDPITFSIKQEEEEKTPTDTQAPNSLDTKESSDKANPILQQETPADQFTLKVIPPKPPIDHPDNPNYQRQSTRIANRGAQANTTKRSLIQQAEYDNPKFKPKRFRDIQQSKF
ncbi:hypothetical protein PCANC_28702 [Puccinia coronata f. sp. avenae]|uniref:Uncharacterized protein n=1 Tax=Puccinia coronata f. sp. avenae TaxID=200324 RepID=A0A2N5TF53_9BASI|nr:hypothetical protein PCANC_28702 [Puccinia coronata f. sp. avenae]